MGAPGVACAVAVGFYVAVERRLRPSLAGRPVAVVRDGRAIDLSSDLQTRGLVLGTGRSALLQLCPEAAVAPYEPARYEEGGRLLLDLYARHVPAVEPLDLTHAFLDVAGVSPDPCSRIGREAAIGLGVTVGFGLGPTKLTARAAGLELVARGIRRSGETLAVPGDLSGTGPGGDGTAQVRAFLAPLPVSYLYPLPDGVAERLARLGFGTIGEVQGLPLRELARQFGWPLARRIAEAAEGGAADRVRPAWPPPALSVSRTFEGGLVDREGLVRALREAAGRLAREMTGRGQASDEVRLVFLTEGGRRLEASRRLARPTRSPVTLECILAALAGRLLPAGGEPPVAMEARVGRVRPLPAAQLEFGFGGGGGLSAPPLPAEGIGREEARDVARELAWCFGGKVLAGPGEDGLPAPAGSSGTAVKAGGTGAGAGDCGDIAAAARRSRRERLLIFYDPLRAGA